MIFDYKLDKYVDTTPIKETCKQNDTVYLNIEIFERGVQKELNSTDYMATFSLLKPDNTLCIITMTDVDKLKIEDKKVKVKLLEECTKVNGIAKWELRVTNLKNNDEDFSFTQEIEINPSILITNPTASQNASNLIDDMKEVTDKGTNIIKDINDTVTNADNTLKDFESKYPNATTLYNDVANIKQLGIRNLFKNSRTFSDNWSVSNDASIPYVVYTDSSGNTTDPKPYTYKGLYVYETKKNWGSYRQKINLEKDKDYTMSVYLKANVDDINVNYYCGVDDTTKNYGGNVTSNVSTEWKRYTFTFTAEQEGETLLRVEPSNIESKNGTLSVCGYMLVEGKFTSIDHVLALEDFSSLQTISGNDLLYEGESGQVSNCRGLGCTNAPNDVSWWFYDIKTHSDLYKNIIAKNYSNGDIKEKYCNNGTWSDWIDILTTKSSIAASQITEDTTHKFVTSAEKQKIKLSYGEYTSPISNTQEKTVGINNSYTHFKVTWYITNKQNVSDFIVSVGTGYTELVRETGGGAIVYSIEFILVDSTNNTWMYITDGHIANTAVGMYNSNFIGVITLDKIEQVTLHSETVGDLFDGGIAVLEYLKEK